MFALAVFLLLLTETTPGWSEPDTRRAHDGGGGGGCIVKEREALLSIKASITADPERLLSSWRGHDCCRWEGVRCSNMTTSHVVELDLHARYVRSSLGGYNLTGPRGHLPDFVGSLRDLRYLNLSNLNFSGTVPHQLGNLSRLGYLDLRCYGGLHSDDLSWLPQLSFLKYLDMSDVDLSAAINWVDSVNTLASLEVLKLTWCSLNNTGHFVSRSNLTRLKILDISFSSIDMQFNDVSWVWEATSLEYLNLEHSGIHGVFPARLANLSSLQVLQLSGNHLKGMIPDTLTSLCSLRILELAWNDVQGDMAEFIERLPKCSWRQLEVLRLGENNITGSLSDGISRMTSLTTLDLSFNRLTGALTTSISTLSNLVYLNLVLSSH